MKQYITSYRYHPTEVAKLLTDLHKEHGQTPGIEISIRYGTDFNSIDKDRVASIVVVSKTDSASLYKGSHSYMYDPELVDA